MAVDYAAIISAALQYFGQKERDKKAGDSKPLPLSPEEQWKFDRQKENYAYDPSRHYTNEYASQLLEGINKPGGSANYQPEYRSEYFKGQTMPKAPSFDFSSMPKYWRPEYKNVAGGQPGPVDPGAGGDRPPVPPGSRENRPDFGREIDQTVDDANRSLQPRPGLPENTQYSPEETAQFNQIAGRYGSTAAKVALAVLAGTSPFGALVALVGPAVARAIMGQMPKPLPATGDTFANRNKSWQPSSDLPPTDGQSDAEKIAEREAMFRARRGGDPTYMRGPGMPNPADEMGFDLNDYRRYLV